MDTSQSLRASFTVYAVYAVENSIKIIKHQPATIYFLNSMYFINITFNLKK